MDAYSVTKYRTIRIGHEGGAIVGTIAKNGSAVISLENGGYGGPTEFSTVRGQAPCAISDFFSAMLATWIQFGGKKEDFHNDDTADCWAEWYAHTRKTGRLWRDEVREMQAFSDGCKAHRAQGGV